MAGRPLTNTSLPTWLDGLRDEGRLLNFVRVVDRLLMGTAAPTPGRWHDRRRAGQGREFLDFQAHAPGTDVRRVDWRASARSRVLVERRYQAQRGGTWCVCLDESASMGVPGSLSRDLSLQLAAALSFYLLHRECSVSFLRFAHEVTHVCPPARGEDPVRTYPPRARRLGAGRRVSARTLRGLRAEGPVRGLGERPADRRGRRGGTVAASRTQRGPSGAERCQRAAAGT